MDGRILLYASRRGKSGSYSEKFVGINRMLANSLRAWKVGMVMKKKQMMPKKAPMKLSPAMASRIRAKASRVMAQPGAGVRADPDSAAGAAT